ncbi:outer membrane protein assembly factor BamD [Myxococcota bacterium]
MSTGQDLPARWRDDQDAPPQLREIGRVLESLAEPAGPGARARVWESLKARPRRRALRVAWVAATVVVLVVAATQVPRFFPPDVAEVELVVGEITMSQSADRQSMARVGQQLKSNTRLRTSEQGQAMVRLYGVGTTLLSESTEAVVTDHGEKIELSKGTVVAAVKPRKKHRPFAVVAGKYQIRVIGTLFKVTRPRTDGVEVSVWEGTVEVRGPNGRETISAGGSFSSHGQVVAPVRQDWVDLLLSKRGRAPSDEPDTLASEPDAASASQTQPRRRRAAQRRFRKRTTRNDPTAPPTSTEEHEIQPPEDDDASKYARAVATQDPRRAIALFDELAAAGGPRAEIAAYQAARLWRSLDLGEAARRFQQLLALHPRGVFSQEARLELIECTMKLGKMRLASEHVEIFLSSHRDSERIAEVRFLRAEILRQWKKDCKAALVDYEIALSSSRRAEDALFFKAWCLLEGKDVNQAFSILESYLQRFPRGRHAKEARLRLEEMRARKKD